MSDRVSIIIPAYNAAAYVAQTIESALNQTHPHCEIIVVDDGSTDDTAMIAEQYSVTVIRQQNQGVALARNTGIAHATGDYFQFLDADDWLLPEKIAASLRYFQQHPTADIIYTDYEVRDGDMQTRLPNPEIDYREGQLFEYFLNLTSTMFKLPCPLVKRSIVESVNGFRDGMQGVEDWNFWVRVAHHGAEFRYLDQVLVVYRLTPNSLSKHRINMAYSRLHAMQQLREEGIAPLYGLEDKIAGRHHALAMVLWEHNQRTQARHHLQQTIRLKSDRATVQWILWGLSFLIPLKTAEWLLALRPR